MELIVKLTIIPAGKIIPLEKNLEKFHIINNVKNKLNK